MSSPTSPACSLISSNFDFPSSYNSMLSPQNEEEGSSSPVKRKASPSKNEGSSPPLGQASIQEQSITINGRVCPVTVIELTRNDEEKSATTLPPNLASPSVSEDDTTEEISLEDPTTVQQSLNSRRLRSFIFIDQSDKSIDKSDESADNKQQEGIGVDFLPNLHKNQTIPPLEETAVSKALTPIKNDEDDDNLSSPQVKDKEISFLCQDLVDDPKFPELTETVPPVSKALLDPPSPASLATDASLNSPNKKSIRGITYGMFDDPEVLKMQMSQKYSDNAAHRIKVSLDLLSKIKMAQNVDSNFRARFLKNEPKDTWESLHERLSPTIEFFVGIKKNTCLLASQIALWDESNELTPISSCLKGLIASGSLPDCPNPTAGEVPSTGQSSKMIRSIGPELAKRAKAEPKTKNFELYHFHAERALLVLTAQRADNIARAYLDKIIDLYKGADRLEQAVKAKTFQHKYIVLFVYNRYPSCNICHHVFKSVIDDLELLIRTKFIGHCNTLYSAHKGIETIQPHLMILHKHMSQESSLLLNNETTEFYLPQSMAK